MRRVVSSALWAALFGCMTSPVIDYQPLDALPAAMRHKIDIAPVPLTALGIGGDSSPLGSAEDILLPLEVLLKDGGDVGLEGPVAIPMRMADDLASIQCTISSPYDLNAKLELPFTIDTGGNFDAMVSARTAAKARLWISAEIGQVSGRGVFGEFPVAKGLFGSLRMGPVYFSPVPCDVNLCGGATGEMIGIKTLERFGGVLFDWERKKLVFLPKGWSARGLADSSGWVSVDWTARPILKSREASTEQHGDLIVESFTEQWSISETRWLTIEYDGKPYTAEIDTGADCEILAYIELSPREDTTRITGNGHGLKGKAQVARLSAPLKIGGLVFRHVDASFPDAEERERERSCDMLIGLRLLQKQPLLLDFDAGMLRFGVDAGATPPAP